MSKISANPTVKEFLTITGEGFGTKRDEIKCFMDRKDKDNLYKLSVYELNVYSTTDTKMVVFLKGGLIGDFKIRL